MFKITLRDGNEYQFAPLPFTKDVCGKVDRFASGDINALFELLEISALRSGVNLDNVLSNFDFCDAKKKESDLSKIIGYLLGV